MHDTLFATKKTTQQVPRFIIGVAALFMLSACTPTAGADSWGSGNYNAGTSTVGILGPSGPIGP